jgi:carboxyl-terminal processing protease
MRRMILGLVVAVAAPAFAANPRDGSPPGSSELLRAQAASYATDMMEVLRWVEQNYVRPVPRAALAQAALAGLYETAREPMPASLLADLAQAKEAGQFSHLFATARERLGDVEALRDRAALHASLRSLPRALDPYCGIRDPNDLRSGDTDKMEGAGLEFESLPDALQPKVHINDAFDRPRAGAESTMARGPARISAVIPGSPAQRAGVREGDILTLINEQPIETPEGTRLFAQLGTASTFGHDVLRLTLQRPGRDEPVQCSVLPIEFHPEAVYGVRRRTDHSWDFMLDREHRIAYVRLGFIDTGADAEMEEAILSLKAAGIRGLIFDLRGNPGGFLTPAQSISGMFVKSGLVATMIDRGEDGKERRQPIQLDNGSGILEGIPTVALIDGDTRGGGEMIAAVLQDHKVARIAGQRSFGKGSVQRPSDMVVRGEQIKFKLTSGSFTRPNGRNLNRFPDSKRSDDWGIRPDAGLEIPVTPELARKLKAWMHDQVLRPGDSREGLPLDDPENDPAREFARQLLLKQIK